MTDDLPRLGLRPNPDAPLGYDLYLHDDGNAWTGWLRVEIGDPDHNEVCGVLTKDGERDLIELEPASPRPQRCMACDHGPDCHGLNGCALCREERRSSWAHYWIANDSPAP